MGRKKITSKQIIFKLREIEVPVGKAKSFSRHALSSAVTEQTYYRWCREYGGMGTSPQVFCSAGLL